MFIRLVGVAAHKVWKAYRAQVHAQELLLRSQRPWEAQWLRWDERDGQIELVGSILPPPRRIPHLWPVSEQRRG